MTTERRKAGGLAIGLAILAALVGWLVLRASEDDRAGPALEKSRRVAQREPPPLQLEGRAPKQPVDKPQGEEPAVEPRRARTPAAATPKGPIRIEGVFQRVGTRASVDVGTCTLRWWIGEARRNDVKPQDVEVTTDRAGRFVVDLDSSEKVNIGGIWPKDGAWRSHAWYPEGGKPGDKVTAVPDAPTRMVVEVTAMLQLTGIVVDPEGQPLSDVTIQYAVPHGNASKVWGGYRTTTREDGAFAISGVLAHPEAIVEKEVILNASLVRFQRSGFTALALNVHDVDVADRENWRVVLSRGLSIRGVLIDDAGRTIAGAEVEAVYEDPTKRRTATSDANGAFEISALAEGALTLRALVLAEDLEARKAMTLSASEAGVELVALPIPPAEPGGPVPVLGLRLVDATEALRKEHHLPEHASVVVLDPGANHARLGIGTLRAGCGIWKIGNENVTSVRQMVERILAEHAKAKKANPQWATVRIVYVYGGTGPTAGWSNTQHLTLSADDLASLERTAAALR